MPDAPRISTIKGLGPAMESALNAAGIMDADELRAMGAHAAYGKMLANGHRPHFIGYYALVMTLQGRPWNDCKGKEKDALREKFDALLSETAPLNEFERILDEIGVRAP